MLIDSHHHLWSYSATEYPWISESMSVLKADFLTRQLDEIAVHSAVDGFVSVQARQSIAETQSLLDIAGQSDRILGVVGWVPLAASDVAEHLDRLTQSPWLKAVRHVVQDEPDERFLLGEDFNRGVSQLVDYGLVYDLLIYARQLPSAIEFADRHPHQPLVIDHIAKPTIACDRFDQQWEKDFRELAKRPHVVCKFSGVVTEILPGGEDQRSTDWSIDHVRPYWEVAIDAFSPSRLMFGSDWPVCLLRTDYARWLNTVCQLASSLSPAEQARIFATNAMHIYRLHSPQ